MTTIYHIRVEFMNTTIGIREQKEFDFVSKDTEVDFFKAATETEGCTVVSRYETAAYDRGEFLLAINAFEIARMRGFK